MKRKQCSRCKGTGEVYEMRYTGKGATVAATLVPCPKCKGAQA